MKFSLKKILIIFLLAFGFLLLRSQSAQAAELFLEPSKESVKSGQDLVIELRLKPVSGEVIDGADAVLKFDAMKLKPKEVKAGSDFKNLITKEGRGKVQITALASTDGAKFDKTAKVASISFQILESGQPKIEFEFSSGSTADSNVAAHGTSKDILTKVAGGEYKVSATPGQQTFSIFRRIFPFLLFILFVIIIGAGIFYWRRRRPRDRGDVFVPHQAPLDRLPEEAQESKVVPPADTTPTSGEGS